MTVALNAGKRCTLPDFPRCIHAVEQGGNSEFFVFGSALIVVHGIAMKSGRDKLIIGWVWQQVSGKLFNSKLIVRHVFVERLNNPIAIAPDGPLNNALVA